LLERNLWNKLIITLPTLAGASFTFTLALAIFACSTKESRISFLMSLATGYLTGQKLNGLS